jgi:hypothetical protein
MDESPQCNRDDEPEHFSPILFALSRVPNTRKLGVGRHADEARLLKHTCHWRFVYVRLHLYLRTV